MKPRLLPLLVIAAGLALTVRVGGMWTDLAGPRAAVAEETGPDEASSPKTMGPETMEGEAMEVGAMEVDAEKVQPPADELAALAADPFALTDTEIDLLQKLAERRSEIERQAEELEERRLLLTAAEHRVDQKVEELKALQVMIQELLVQHDEKEEARFDSLVKIYESMKPKDAARIFEELDMVVLLDVIERMKERKTAPILAQMNPERAKEITLELAQRRELPKQAGAQ